MKTRRVVCNARPVAETQAVYYRDKRGGEPVHEFIGALPAKRAAKIDDYVEEHLNGQRGRENARAQRAETHRLVDGSELLDLFIYIDKLAT